MVTIKNIADRKIALLDRYRTALLDEMLEEKRAEAAVEVENDRFAWKGAFRSRDEIMALYKERRRWDRRFLVDTAVLALLLLGIVAASPQIVGLVAPKSTWLRGQNSLSQSNSRPESSPAQADQLGAEDGAPAMKSGETGSSDIPE
jgi:hypothetical protein